MRHFTVGWTKGRTVDGALSNVSLIPLSPVVQIYTPFFGIVAFASSAVVISSFS